MMIWSYWFFRLNTKVGVNLDICEQLWGVDAKLHQGEKSPAFHSAKNQCAFQRYLSQPWSFTPHTSGRNMDWEKKCNTVVLVLNWHMIMCRLRIQKLKIGNWGGFEKIDFFLIFLMRKRLPSGQKRFLRPYFPLIWGMFVLRSEKSHILKLWRFAASFAPHDIASLQLPFQSL